MNKKLERKISKIERRHPAITTALAIEGVAVVSAIAIAPFKMGASFIKGKLMKKDDVPVPPSPAPEPPAPDKEGEDKK